MQVLRARGINSRGTVIVLIVDAFSTGLNNEKQGFI